ncbi:uncharacterized protein DS421_13g408690 [Arachis hypogaea]|nr:uncharacterized protein DS421_13g408690 [Arachis hypogaea]
MEIQRVREPRGRRDEEGRGVGGWVPPPFNSSSRRPRRARPITVMSRRKGRRRSCLAVTIRGGRGSKCARGAVVAAIVAAAAAVTRA